MAAIAGGLLLLIIAAALVDSGGAGDPPGSASGPAPQNRPTATPVPSFAELRQSAERIPYDDLFRNNEAHTRKLVYYQGRIVQVIDGRGDNYQFRVNVTRGEYGWWDDTVYLRYSGPRLLENDIIEFVGRVDGLMRYRTVLGAQVTVPDITALQTRRIVAE